MLDTTIRACIGNYGGYAAGVLVDRWVDLPMPPEKLDAALGEIQAEAEQAAGAPCEEFYISDYDGYPLDAAGVTAHDLFTEQTPIESLNLMAAQLSTMSEDEIEAASAYIGQQGSTLTMNEAMNVLLQADEVAYYGYDWQPYTGDDPIWQGISDSRTAEFKYGATCIEQNPALKKLLDDDPCIDAAFDYEEYGRQASMADGSVLFDGGYLADEKIDMEYYSKDQVAYQTIENLMAENDPEFAELGASFAKDMGREAPTFPGPEAFAVGVERHGTEEVVRFDYQWGEEKPLEIQIARSSVTGDFSWQMQVAPLQPHGAGAGGDDRVFKSGIASTFDEAWKGCLAEAACENPSCKFISPARGTGDFSKTEPVESVANKVIEAPSEKADRDRSAHDMGAQEPGDLCRRVR